MDPVGYIFSGDKLSVVVFYFIAVLFSVEFVINCVYCDLFMIKDFWRSPGKSPFVLSRLSSNFFLRDARRVLREISDIFCQICTKGSRIRIQFFCPFNLCWNRAFVPYTGHYKAFVQFGIVITFV